jgi:hypothetical protein
VARPLLIQPGGGQRQQQTPDVAEAHDEDDKLIHDVPPADVEVTPPGAAPSLKRQVVVKQKRETQADGAGSPGKGKAPAEKHPSQTQLERAKYLGELDNQHKANEEKVLKQKQQAYERTKAVEALRERNPKLKVDPPRQQANVESRAHRDPGREARPKHEQRGERNAPARDDQKRDVLAGNRRPDHSRGHGRDPREGVALQQRLDKQRQAKLLQDQLEEEKTLLRRVADQGRQLLAKMFRRREDEAARIEREHREQKLRLEREYRRAQEATRQQQERAMRPKQTPAAAPAGERGSPRRGLEDITRRAKLDKFFKDQQVWLEKRYRDLRSGLERQRRESLQRLEQFRSGQRRREQTLRFDRLRLDQQRAQQQHIRLRQDRQRYDRQRQTVERQQKQRQEQQKRERQARDERRWRDERSRRR